MYVANESTRQTGQHHCISCPIGPSCQALLTTNQPSNSVTVMLYMYKSSTLKLINRQSGGIHLLLRNGVIERGVE
jgi:hypothetical protein